MATALKGVILAGGTGSRLHPLTQITNKHLLPIYDRPMISWSIEALVKAGVTELMLVTGGTHAGEFFRLLGDGHEYGIDRLFYGYPEGGGGIAGALRMDRARAPGRPGAPAASRRRGAGRGPRPSDRREAARPAQRIRGHGD